MSKQQLAQLAEHRPVFLLRVAHRQGGISQRQPHQVFTPRLFYHHGDQGWAAGGHRQVQCGGKAVAVAVAAGLRVRQPAGGHYHLGRKKVAAGGSLYPVAAVFGGDGRHPVL